ncbi:MAG: hypothetical protein PWQ32_1135 [Thermococcaceae archaeon]|jgi:hypothetical protein|uniref:hypothetical protein n=1 Tax=Thermococcus bergensis TaxID=2689387 RepID=UPI001CED1AC5|nr:hypothetical protein [Thermococcus bergensis]MCA6212951.1 hypothetical protein [Thermococcus bergensis]MDK2783546.1 hypothetical protein [Thermococcaceae archaeon]MDK2983436.1 hypothetical protein [Thermococcaceae archaeon]
MKDVDRILEELGADKFVRSVHQYRTGNFKYLLLIPKKRGVLLRRFAGLLGRLGVG